MIEDQSELVNSAERIKESSPQQQISKQNRLPFNNRMNYASVDLKKAVLAQVRSSYNNDSSTASLPSLLGPSLENSVTYLPAA